MIVGIGSDIIDSRRVSEMLHVHGFCAYKKLMLQSEIDFYERRSHSALDFAKVFSAKEAVFKAIGVLKTLVWKDIEVVHMQNGAPKIKIHNETMDSLINLIREKIRTEVVSDRILPHLTITDEYPYACAYCVLEYAL